MKCSVNPQTLLSLKGRDVTLDINGRQQIARCAEGIFGVADGQFCFSEGSSGWFLPDGSRVQFAEVVQRGGSAAHTFSMPKGGSRISWR